MLPGIDRPNADAVSFEQVRFNVLGQPIVNTPREAIETFLNTSIEFLSFRKCSRVTVRDLDRVERFSDRNVRDR
jgi:hypothetical protein